ncbi:MAG: type I 3-dehydroquinate dehydratase [Firmicutes bacterium]|nr:type I 3-dehydroquinate dehydratase [Bacillota bacterium]
MKKLVVGNLELDMGRPKVAVPLTGKTHEEIIEQCKKLLDLPCDIIEWRVDFFLDNIEDLERKLAIDEVHAEVIRILDDIDYITGSMPVIFTVRSKSQGGRCTLNKEQVYDLNSLAAQSQLVKFVDVELFDDHNKVVRDVIVGHVDDIHSFGCKVIMSFHDFKSMPKSEEILNIVDVMRSFGADIAKVVAFAHNKKDAVNMIKCSNTLTQGDKDPVILIGMGKNGLLTRIIGGQYGSAITFASLEETTAHGQMDVKTVHRLLDEYYTA